MWSFFDTKERKIQNLLAIISDGDRWWEHLHIAWCENVFHSSCTLPGGSHCFQPVHTPCTGQAAARGVGRWCSSLPTAQWHTPSRPRTPRYHWLVLPSWNPEWWEFDVLHKRRQKTSFCQSRWLALVTSFFSVWQVLCFVYYNYASSHISLFSSDSPGLASLKGKNRKNLHVNITNDNKTFSDAPFDRRVTC